MPRASRTSAGDADALRRADPVLGRLIDSLEPVDLGQWRARWRLDSFRSLARAIVGQPHRNMAAGKVVLTFSDEHFAGENEFLLDVVVGH